MIFSCENKDDETIAFMNRTSVECRERIDDVTIPLYSEQYGRTMLCGSGVLLKVSDKSFIVSAGHTAGADAKRRNVDDIKLVAIDHRWWPKTKVLVGTRIRYALQMIYRNHADLTNVMEMHFGQNAHNL